MDAVEKRKIPRPWRESNTYFSSIQPVARRYTGLEVIQVTFWFIFWHSPAGSREKGNIKTVHDFTLAGPEIDSFGITEILISEQQCGLKRT
jgi:hypothetical protein